jgi:hypothetical protein
MKLAREVEIKAEQLLQEGETVQDDPRNVLSDWELELEEGGEEQNQ